MPLYVLALADRPPGRWTPPGRALHTVNVDGIYAICERRQSVPAATDDFLRRQHAVLVQLADRVPALLPARYGAFMTKAALVTLLRSRETEIRVGLDEVRGRVQMSLRVLGQRQRSSRLVASTGREYLEQRRRAASPALPRSTRSLLASLRPLVARERREPGAGPLLATVYHLVDAAQVPSYRRILDRSAPAAVIVSGPWPAFAFAPEPW